MSDLKTVLKSTEFKRILKYNPYRGAGGKFTSRAKATSITPQKESGPDSAKNDPFGTAIRFKL